jgi:hypothetical protein
MTKRQRCPTCKRLEQRSTQANARYWLLLHEIATNLKPQGNVYSAEQWHTYFKSRFLGCDEVTMPNGKALQIPRSSADLDTSEFNDYQTQVEAWAAERDVFLADMAA